MKIHITQNKMFSKMNHDTSFLLWYFFCIPLFSQAHVRMWICTLRSFQRGGLLLSIVHTLQ